MPAEIWKAVKIKEFKGEYMVSEYGKVKKRGYYTRTHGHWVKGRIIKSGISTKGYCRINLNKNGIMKSFFIHRLVAFAFIENPLNKPCVNHKDGVKTNNHYSNLEWCTNAENNYHASINGFFIGGNGYLTKEQRLFIIDNFLTMGREALAKQFNKTEEYITDVFTNRGKYIKVSLKKLGATKKRIPRFKQIINTETLELFTSDSLAASLNTTEKEINRMINEERKPNTSPYRRTGNYVQSNRTFP